jgi:hypothetical protein
MTDEKAKGKRQKAKLESQRVRLSPFALATSPSAAPDFPGKRLWLFLLFLACFPCQVFAQFGSVTGVSMNLIGMVQVEPGSNVITLGVKDTEIRFAVNDVESSLRNFSSTQLLAETRHRSPSMDVKAPEHLLDLLLKEKPRKRVLKLIGRYYPDARRFLLDKVTPIQEGPKPQF